MCGLAGTVGRKKNHAAFINTALKALQYRGYDSYGYYIGAYTRDYLFKVRGSNIANIKNEIDTDRSMCHTRWATQGESSIENTHPFRGGPENHSNNIWLVHNGNIDNKNELLEQLKNNGYIPQLEGTTDSEILAHYIYFYQHTMNLTEIMDNIKGQIACIIAYRRTPNFLHGFSRGAPLLLSDNDELASEASVFANNTRYYRLHDNEVISMGYNNNSSTRIGYITTEDFNNIYKEEKREQKSLDDAMLSEIKEQADLLSKAPNNNILLPFLSKEDNLTMFGCGSSYNAALFGQRYLEDIAMIPSKVEYASELLYKDKISDSDKFLALTQSGETKDTVECLKRINRKNRYLLTNMPDSEACTISLAHFLNAGKEYAVASTKTFTMMVKKLLEMASRHGLLEIDYLPMKKAVEDLIDNIDIKTLALMMIKYSNALVLGRQYDYFASLELALKLKEICYIHAEAMPSAEMKHGPIALIDKNTVSLFLVSDNLLQDKIIHNMNEIKSRGGKIFCICNSVITDKLKQICEYFIPIKLSGIDFYLRPIVLTVAGQILAYRIAKLKGINPAMPRNLAKTVTVE